MRKKDIRDYKDIKRVLIVVDMVNGFCKEGVMADNKAMDVVGLQKVLIGDYLNSDDGVVVFVKEAHSENAVEFKDFPRHCVEGERESMIIDELDCYVKDSFVIGKNCTSFMVVSEFKEFIDKMSNLESVMGCGVCIDICVPNGIIPLKNYFNQNNRDVDVVVNMDASETYDSVTHNRDEYRGIISKILRLNGIGVINNRDKVSEYESGVIASYGELFSYYKNLGYFIEKCGGKWFIYMDSDYKCMDNIDMVVDYLIKGLSNNIRRVR